MINTLMISAQKSDPILLTEKEPNYKSERVDRPRLVLHELSWGVAVKIFIIYLPHRQGNWKGIEHISVSMEIQYVEYSMQV